MTSEVQHALSLSVSLVDVLLSLDLHAREDLLCAQRAELDQLQQQTPEVRKHRARDLPQVCFGSRWECPRQVFKRDPAVKEIGTRHQPAEPSAACPNEGHRHEPQATADGLHEGKLEPIPHSRSRSHNAN
jgi:hypothetical protein